MVKCANCGGTFEAKAEPPPSHRETPPSTARRNTPPPSSRRPVAAPSDSSRARRRDKEDDDLEPCPFCRGRNRIGASRCRHCGEVLDDEEEERIDDRPWKRGLGPRRDSEPHRGPMVLILGIVSIACAVVGAVVFCCWPLGFIMVAAGFGTGIPAWVMGHRDLAKMNTGQMDPRGRGTTQGGWICGMVGTILNILSLLVVTAWAVVHIFGMAIASTVPPPPPPPPQNNPPPPRRKMELDSGPPRVSAWMGRDLVRSDRIYAVAAGEDRMTVVNTIASRE
jgi:hypothetical protein